MVRSAALSIGLRLLDEAVALCLDAGESAANVRYRVLCVTDRIIRQSMVSVHDKGVPNQDAISGCVGNLSVLLSLLSKRV